MPCDITRVPGTRGMLTLSGRTSVRAGSPQTQGSGSGVSMHPLSRRAVLSAGVALAVAACSPSADAPPAPEQSTPSESPPDPDLGLRGDVAAQEWALVALYDSALATPGTLDPSLLALMRDQHREHAAALGSAEPPAGAPTSATGSPSTAPAPGGDVRARLIESEQQAAGARTDACGAARDPDLVRLLALIASSEASHAESLRGTA